MAERFKHQALKAFFSRSLVVVNRDEIKGVLLRIAHRALLVQEYFDDTSPGKVVGLTYLVFIACALCRSVRVNVLSNVEIQTHRRRLVNLSFQLAVRNAGIKRTIRAVSDRIVLRDLTVSIHREQIHLDGLKLAVSALERLNDV